MERPANLSASGRSQALRHSIRKLLARQFAIGIGLTVVGCAGAGLAAMRAAGVDAHPAVVAALVALVVGSVAGIAIALFAAAKMSFVAAQSIELLFEHPEIAEGLPSETLHGLGGTGLSIGQLRHDVEALRRLIRRASRRSAGLTTELHQARETAAADRSAKESFLGRIGHDLRTPLNSILGYATLLHEDAVNAGERAAAADLERILGSARQLLSVINGMLGYAKIAPASSSVERQVIDIRHFAGSVVAGEQIGGAVQLQVDEDIGIIVGDAAKLRQCLDNLLGAATKAGAAGPVTLTITHAVSAEGPAVSFAVESGARSEQDPNEVTRMAERAALAEGSNQIDLGLVVARRLAALMRGNCSVETVHEATCFRLIVPRSLRTGDSVGTDGIAGQQPRTARKEGKCALIVDDDEATLELMRRWLEDMGYDVLLAFDGETGLKLARHNRPDLILLDGILPGRSGYEILAELRSDPLIGRTPIIFITVDDDRCRGIRCGASDYLRKPLSQSHLKRILEVYAGTSAGEILIIEDDDDAAELVRRAVEEVGFSTRRARNGVEGLEMAIAARPSAIVLDVRMPKLDGFGVIEALTRAAGMNDLPIVVVSGRDMGLAEHQRLAGSARRVFTKGIVSPREIAQSLQELVA